MAIGWQDELEPSKPDGVDASVDGGEKSVTGQAVDAIKNVFG